jgi:hypothetical protein
MKFGAKITGLLLILAMPMASLATGASALPAERASAPSAIQGTGSPEHPAVCHAHGGKTLPQSELPRSPLPKPTSYQCCLTGHNAALVQAPYQTQLLVQSSHLKAQIEAVLTTSPFDSLESFTVISTDPPGKTPLRI